MPAINSHRNLIINNTIQTMERLSSGLKINRGADGPASLVISERLDLKQPAWSRLSTIQRLVALVQTAEAALNEVSSALINARQLAVASERSKWWVHAGANQQEIDNIRRQSTELPRTPNLARKPLDVARCHGCPWIQSEFAGASQATQSSGPMVMTFT